MDIDGTNAIPLTHIEIFEDGKTTSRDFDYDREYELESLSWSPDSRYIVFQYGKIGANPPNRDIYLVNTDGQDWRSIDISNGRGDLIRVSGSGLTQLIFDDDNGADPAWSPDGNTVVYSSADNSDIVVKIDGNNINLLGRSASEPAWSSSGKRIAAISDGVIYLFNADGSNAVPLTPRDWGDKRLQPASLSWSPDGKEIAFSDSFYADGGTHIYHNMYVVSVDEPMILQELGEFDEYDNSYLPTWSPDGKRIAFASERDGDDEIYVMDADGSNITKLTNDLVYDDRDGVQEIFWSPDGLKILFTVEYCYTAYCDPSDLYIMNADGTNFERLVAIK